MRMPTWLETHSPNSSSLSFKRFFSVTPAAMPMSFCRLLPASKKKEPLRTPRHEFSGSTRFEPLADTKPDWQIIQEIANRLGASWTYRHPSEIMREIASLTPLFAGVTYERLEGYKTLQWPVHPDGSDEPLLFTERFNFPDGKARFFPVAWSEPAEPVDAEFDLHLNNGRLLEHFHEGNLTYR